MPGPDKSFEQFQADDAVCRQRSLQQAGGPPRTALAQGIATGAAIGASAGMSAGYGFQRRYDVADEQCMYAKGNDTPRVSPSSTPPPRR